MTECIAPQSCFKPCMWRICAKKRGYELPNLHFKTAQRKFSHGSCMVVWLSTCKGYNLSSAVVSLSVTPFWRETSLRYLGSLLNADGTASSDWLPFGDQFLMMTSIFLTYMAGAIPGRLSFLLKVSAQLLLYCVFSGNIC
ncbi:hypothetical protein HS088_TW06G00490 [Tripterygium wilfordii]|uniref:Uncharacterized protein n=1 Tax=Tripterygium wilfordii TaxID=458696 RepID=A0A7J7DJ51_TRIWF|nr:hypothetical protein HS088_TW06G00490 [Tripterygium wilfordii]